MKYLGVLSESPSRFSVVDRLSLIEELPSVDLNTTAFRIVKKLTEESKDLKEKRGAAGGRAGGAARAARLTPERRREIAISANWARKRKGGSNEQ